MLSQERLKELLHYDHETGVFTRLVGTGGTATGSRAGHISYTGYEQINVDKVKYLSHRLAWLYMTGGWPEEMVDHVNGIPSDNRWTNLRAASHSENTRNSKNRWSNLSSPHKNVSKTSSGWQVKVAGYTWRCKTLEEAVKLAHKMREHYHGEFANHGDTK